MRIRTIKPEFWKHDRVAEMTYSARLLFIADGSRRYSTGCQVQIVEEEFLGRVQRTHGGNAHALEYRAAVEFAKAVHALATAPAAQ